MKLTPWYPPEILPVRKGAYEVMDDGAEVGIHTLTAENFVIEYVTLQDLRMPARITTLFYRRRQLGEG